MSKIDNYKQAMIEHKAMVEFLKNTEHTYIKGNTYYNPHVHAVNFARKRNNSEYQGDILNRRYASFLAMACIEIQEQICSRAIEISKEDVASKRTLAQEESIEFIKSMGATERD